MAELDVAGSVETPSSISCLLLFGKEALGNHVNLFVRELTDWLRKLIYTVPHGEPCVKRKRVGLRRLLWLCA